MRPGCLVVDRGQRFGREEFRKTFCQQSAPRLPRVDQRRQIKCSRLLRWRAGKLRFALYYESTSEEKSLTPAAVDTPPINLTTTILIFSPPYKNKRSSIPPLFPLRPHYSCDGAPLASIEPRNRWPKRPRYTEAQPIVAPIVFKIKLAGSQWKLHAHLSSLSLFQHVCVCVVLPIRSSLFWRARLPP